MGSSQSLQLVAIGCLRHSSSPCSHAHINALPPPTVADNHSPLQGGTHLPLIFLNYYFFLPRFAQGMHFDLQKPSTDSSSVSLVIFAHIGFPAAPLPRQDDWGLWELKYWYAFEPDYLKQLPQLAQIAGVPDPARVHGNGQQLLQQPAVRALRRLPVWPARLLPVPRQRPQLCAIQRKVLRPGLQLLLWCIQLLWLQLFSDSSRYR